VKSEVKNMRAALYYRVSTKLQEKRFSLAAQKTELIAYATAQDWKVINEFTDVDSGGKLDKKGLNALLDLVEEGRIDVVLCIDQNRLSRLDTVAWEYLKSTLRENNVKIAEPGTITDLADDDQEFISDIKNLIAKREKKGIVRAMMRGKRQRMREGKGFGKAPIGYIFNKKTKEYELDDKWAWVIPMIDDLYLNRQLGMKSIGDELNKISRTPSGNLWNETLVYRRLVSKAFHGVMEKTFANGETITIDDLFPPIRTEETWNKIQEERKKRSVQFKSTSRQRDDLHILRRTLITCGECGRKIHLAQHGNKEGPLYYLKHGRKLRISDETACDISINTIRVEKNIIMAIKDIITNEELARNYIDLEMDSSEMMLLEKQTKKYDSLLKGLQTKLDKLIDLYLESALSKEILAKKQAEIENEINTLTTQNKQAIAKLEVLRNNSFNYDFIYELFEIAEGFETDLTPLEKAQVMGSLFPNGVLFHEKLILKAVIKNVPLDVEIPMNPDPYAWHHTKKGNV
jgi:site-specific DNA recombinase